MLNRGMVCLEPHHIQQGKKSSCTWGTETPCIDKNLGGSSAEKDVGGLAKNEPAVCPCSKEGRRHAGCTNRSTARRL